MNERKIRVLDLIITNTSNDAKHFDGQPFNGKTVAEYFGNQGAAIVALANIIKEVIKENDPARDGAKAL